MLARKNSETHGCCGWDFEMTKLFLTQITNHFRRRYFKHGQLVGYITLPE
ncbi:hypothetical protein ESCAB7627_2150 [Escherichia albertii TW07627]|uniref:Uncharacterized protein n=1 Tax=Escherichia albertii (strain TW07627) TaxID=502347 RepID=A0ABC9NL49_ESCAT|nr:hypothetical protein ESCAB7627_2150 [Escherichia albertii TW07627]